MSAFMANDIVWICVFASFHLAFFTLPPKSVAGEDVPLLRCNFSKDSCNWKADPQGSWLISTSSSSPNYNQPNTGLHNGRYLYVNDSHNETRWQRASLHSPWIPANKTHIACLYFWFFARNTFAVRESEIKVVELRRGKIGVLGTISLDSDTDIWMNRKINLYPAGPYYQVRITYVWERIIVSDPLEVFIDDVTIMDNECSKYDLPPVPCPDGKLWRCRNARCIPLGSVCDGNDDCGDYSDEQYESCDASRVRSMAWKLAGPLTAFVIVLVLLFLMCCVHRMKTKESPLGGAEDRMKYRGYDLYTVSDSVMDTYTNEGDGGNMKKSSSQRYLVDDG